MAERITVPACTARAVTLRAGDRLRIVNVAGKQVADFVAFDAGDVNHALSTLHTLVSLGRLFPTRSEEHTSELQSHSDLVCRLLLEKKKKKKHNADAYTRIYRNADVN